MNRGAVVALVAALLLTQGCPSAYQLTYQAETQRLEQEQRASQAAADAAHADASRYAAVVYFDVGSAVVGKDGERELGWLVGKLAPYPQTVLLVQGFADTTGTEATNRTLSDDRARAVSAVLSTKGIAPARLIVEGHGTTSPAATNTTTTGRRNNRRVEVTVR